MKKIVSIWLSPLAAFLFLLCLGPVKAPLLAATWVEFYAQTGFTSWGVGDKLNVDNMYFLIEPRLRLKYLDLFIGVRTAY